MDFFTRRSSIRYSANHLFPGSLKSTSVIFLLLLCSLLTACGYLIRPQVKTGVVNLQPGSYNIDPQHTSVLFKINHMGMSTFVGRFNKVEASLEFDPKKMADAKLSAIINLASVDVNNRELEDSLRGSSWFDVEKFPQASFKTTSVKMLDEQRAIFTGDLTFHGVTAPVELAVIFNGGGDNILTSRYTLGFSATAQIKRSQFGVDYLIPAIGDDVAIEVFAEFQKR
jgi:polyisoprenoid-binding protein YceI